MVTVATVPSSADDNEAIATTGGIPTGQRIGTRLHRGGCLHSAAIALAILQREDLSLLHAALHAESEQQRRGKPP